MFQDEQNKLIPGDMVKVGFFPPHSKVMGLYITHGMIIKKTNQEKMHPIKSGDGIESLLAAYSKPQFKILVEGKIYATPFVKIIKKIEEEDE